jgi:hypothetical protein
MADIDTHPPITDLEAESFEDLRRYITNHDVALVRVNYQGVPRVVIAFMLGQNVGELDEHVNIVPLAMLLNDEMFHAIIPPSGEMVDVGAGQS